MGVQRKEFGILDMPKIKSTKKSANAEMENSHQRPLRVQSCFNFSILMRLPVV